MKDFALYSRRVLLPDGLAEATVFVEQGKIRSIAQGLEVRPGYELLDAGDNVIMPGIIDAHVHINEPGRTEWEGFDTATAAAALGGITTLVDMPLNSDPVSVNTLAFRVKLGAAHERIHVHCGFYGGLIPGSDPHLDELLDSGVLGIKAFLTHSGIEEFPNVSEEDLRAAMPILKKHDALLLVHCELDYPHDGQQELQEHPKSYRAYLQSRPKDWEDRAIALMIRLCEEYDVRVHIVHLSSSDSVAQLRDARARGLRITVETCPHYLVFDAESIPDGDTSYKCAPPIRERANQEALWAALREGVIDFVVTDHSPAPPAIKELDSGDFSRAWGGIAGIQCSLPVMWTALHRRGYGLPDLVRLMSTRIAAFLGLGHAKGSIATGYDADLVIWSPEASFTIQPEEIRHRHKITPYAGMQVTGRVVHTFVGGHHVVRDGQLVEKGRGKIVLKP